MYIDISKPDVLKIFQKTRGFFDRRLIAVSGFFDPIHKGHIEYLRLASHLGDVIVFLNTDTQAVLKKGKPFMEFEDRLAILLAIKYVKYVVPVVDEDRTVCKTLELVKPDFFVKGGDRFAGEIPEGPICNKLNIQIIDGLGEKIQSSSWIIAKNNEAKNE